MESPRICTDRTPPDGRLFSPSRERAVFFLGKTWAVGSELAIGFAPSSKAADISFVREVLVDHLFPHVNLVPKWVPWDSATIRIAFRSGDGAWSYIGKDALGIPSGEQTMNLGWIDKPTTIHEFCHCLGMGHEHQNPRGNPIRWNWPVLLHDLGGPPNNWDRETIVHNVTEVYGRDLTNGSNYDDASIMRYPRPPSWSLDGVGADMNEDLSPLDKEWLAKLYPFATPPPKPTTVLPVWIPPPKISASIGAMGEVDAYDMTVPEDGKYRIDTDGRTDVYMTLLDSTGAVIAENDDDGEGQNALIFKDLDEGRYTVKIRHYSSRGTGEYRIRAMRIV